jgi:Flp pilus assembly secretin CpaC
MMNKSFKKRGLMSMFRSTWPFMVAATIALSAASSAHAADALTVELDGARILKLDNPASDVVIGNPNIADVTVQTPNRLVVIGRAPGVTRLIVMNDGIVTMDTQVVVHGAECTSSQVCSRCSRPDGQNITRRNSPAAIVCTWCRAPSAPRWQRRVAREAAGGGGDGPIRPSRPSDQIVRRHARRRW